MLPNPRTWVSEASVHVNCKLHQQYWSLDLNLAELAARHKNASWLQGRQPIPTWLRQGKLITELFINPFLCPIEILNFSLIPRVVINSKQDLNNTLYWEEVKKWSLGQPKCQGHNPPGLQSFGNRDEGKGWQAYSETGRQFVDSITYSLQRNRFLISFRHPQ